MKIISHSILLLLMLMGLSFESTSQEKTGSVCATIKQNTSHKKLMKIKEKFTKKGVQFDIEHEQRDGDGKLEYLEISLNSHDGFEAEFSYAAFTRKTKIKVERDFNDPEYPIFIGVIRK